MTYSYGGHERQGESPNIRLYPLARWWNWRVFFNALFARSLDAEAVRTIERGVLVVRPDECMRAILMGKRIDSVGKCLGIAWPRPWMVKVRADG